LSLLLFFTRRSFPVRNPCIRGLWRYTVAYWHSERWVWNAYQPRLGSILRPGWI